MTINRDIDYDALADKIASDDWEPSGPCVSIMDLAEVRAFELLRREVADSVLNSVRLARQRGISWSDIARELGTTESEAVASYRMRIGEAADIEGAGLAPVSQDVIGIDFHVRHLAAVELRLREAIERATDADDQIGDFIENYLSRSEDDACYRWNLPD